MYQPFIHCPRNAHVAPSDELSGAQPASDGPGQEREREREREREGVRGARENRVSLPGRTDISSKSIPFSVWWPSVSFYW